MALGNFSIMGSCHTDPRGSFQASLIRNDQEHTEYFSCDDTSLRKVLYEMHKFLMGKDSEAIIAGHRVKRTTIRNNTRDKVELSLGMVNIQVMETKNRTPGTSCLIVELPFSKLQRFEEEEGDY